MHILLLSCVLKFRIWRNPRCHIARDNLPDICRSERTMHSSRFFSFSLLSVLLGHSFFFVVQNLHMCFPREGESWQPYKCWYLMPVRESSLCDQIIRTCFTQTNFCGILLNSIGKSAWNPIPLWHSADCTPSEASELVMQLRLRL